MAQEGLGSLQLRRARPLRKPQTAATAATAARCRPRPGPRRGRDLTAARAFRTRRGPWLPKAKAPDSQTQGCQTNTDVSALWDGPHHETVGPAEMRDYCVCRAELSRHRQAGAESFRNHPTWGGRVFGRGSSALRSLRLPGSTRTRRPRSSDPFRVGWPALWLAQETPVGCTNRCRKRRPHIGPAVAPENVLLPWLHDEVPAHHPPVAGKRAQVRVGAGLGWRAET